MATDSENILDLGSPRYRTLGEALRASRGKDRTHDVAMATGGKVTAANVSTLESNVRPLVEDAYRLVALYHLDTEAFAAQLERELASDLASLPTTADRIIAANTLLQHLKSHRQRYVRTKASRGASRSPLPKIRKLHDYDEPWFGEMVPRDGIEPPTRGSSDRCSTNWYPRILDGLNSDPEWAAVA